MPHIALLGDSIFDNKAYVQGPDVIAQVRALLPAGSTATLLATDGSMMDDIPEQLSRLPAGVTHIVVSIGGNDAIDQSGVMSESTLSMAFALDRLAGIGEQFRRSYSAMLDKVQAVFDRVGVCTIYDARFNDPLIRRIAATALTGLNDAITREAFARGLPIIDLRMLPDEGFANEIEPSVIGGDKIAGAIKMLVDRHDFGRRISEVFVV